MTWNDAWARLNSSGKLEERPQQRTLAEAVFAITENGGTLIGEAPVGVGKSFAYLIPLIWRVKEGQRGVVSTETTALQDQLVDKDLPFLKEKFGDFKFRSLKGRSHYLCTNRAPNEHGIILRLRNKMAALGDGERRDVEHILGYRLDDDDWDVLRGDSDWCAQAKCSADKCYSTRARALAVDADIVVTNHALLRTDAEMGEHALLGDFEHLVVDEAHTLEKVLVDGWGEELSPYERWKSLESVWDGLNAAFMGSEVPYVQEAEKLMLDGFKSVVRLQKLLLESKTGDAVDEFTWKRQNVALAEVYLNGPQSPGIVSALEEYELQGPGRFRAASDIFESTEKKLRAHLETMDKGTRKVRKAMTAARRLARTCGIVAESLETRDGIVVKYGVPYAVIADGWKAWKGEFDVRVRCVPLDISQRAKNDLWADLTSVTLVSGTLSGSSPGDYSYFLKSLGLDDASSLMFVTVNSPFDMAKQQLVYLTPEKDTQVDVPGAQFSLDEMWKVLEASEGRSLVLFTARSELDYAAEELLRRGFPHQVLVQEKVSNKQVLVDEFKRDTSSVLLATKSFFTGVDFPGDACSVVVIAKFPFNQYNTLTRLRMLWWRRRGFLSLYEDESMQVFKQAVGRLIRSETDRGVIAILDQRVANPRENVSKLVGAEVALMGSSVTNQLSDVKDFLADEFLRVRS